jgi:hypothetical protein
MGQCLVSAIGAGAAANQGFRLTLAFVPAGKFSRGRAVRLARQNLRKSTAAISNDGASERAASYPSSIQQSRGSSEKSQSDGKV